MNNIDEQQERLQAKSIEIKKILDEFDLTWEETWMFLLVLASGNMRGSLLEQVKPETREKYEKALERIKWQT